jgi:serine/threonine protein phosphatase PrpC
MLCHSCGVEQMAAARFCEDCGTALRARSPEGAPSGHSNGQPPNHAATDASTCSLCGSGPGAFGADGFCTRCGHERVDVSRNHVEVRISPQLAGVSDVGLKHFSNEDAMTLLSEPVGETLVVCDGVSQSQNPDVAAAAAASAAMAVVRAAIASQSWNHTHDLVTAALQAARIAVRSVPFVQSSGADPPEATIVLAVRRGRRVSLGWVGDSRAYIIDSESARQCTVDHSWLNEVVDAGELSLADAMTSPLAHALTRSLGGPVDSSDEPSQLDFELPSGPCYLVVCSDGLWNYLPDAASMAVLMRAQPAEADALARARALVEFALERGGHDNITVAVLMCQNQSENPQMALDSNGIVSGPG